MFDPYVSTKATGSGLGLAIVQKIVDEHGGLVWVDEAKQGGARFIVRLPLLTAVDDHNVIDDVIEQKRPIQTIR